MSVVLSFHNQFSFVNWHPLHRNKQNEVSIHCVNYSKFKFRLGGTFAWHILTKSLVHLAPSVQNGAIKFEPQRVFVLTIFWLRDQYKYTHRLWAPSKNLFFYLGTYISGEYSVSAIRSQYILLRARTNIIGRAKFKKITKFSSRLENVAVT